MCFLESHVMPNDPSSATRPTRALDCNLDALAGRCSASLGGAVEFVEVAKVMVADASKRSDIVNKHSLPKSFARRYESRVVLTLLLVELVIRKGLEVE